MDQNVLHKLRETQKHVFDSSQMRKKFNCRISHRIFICNAKWIVYNNRKLVAQFTSETSAF